MRHDVCTPTYTSITPVPKNCNLLMVSALRRKSSCAYCQSVRKNKQVFGIESWLRGKISIPPHRITVRKGIHLYTILNLYNYLISFFFIELCISLFYSFPSLLIRADNSTPARRCSLGRSRTVFTVTYNFVANQRMANTNVGVHGSIFGRFEERPN